MCVCISRVSSDGLSLSPSSKLFESLEGKFVKVELSPLDLSDIEQVQWIHVLYLRTMHSWDHHCFLLSECHTRINIFGPLELA